MTTERKGLIKLFSNGARVTILRETANHVIGENLVEGAGENKSTTNAWDPNSALEGAGVKPD